MKFKKLLIILFNLNFIINFTYARANIHEPVGKVLSAENEIKREEFVTNLSNQFADRLDEMKLQIENSENKFIKLKYYSALIRQDFENAISLLENHSQVNPVENKWTIIRRNIHKVLIPSTALVAAAATSATSAMVAAPQLGDVTKYLMYGALYTVVSLTVYLISYGIFETEASSLEQRADYIKIKKLFLSKLKERGYELQGPIHFDKPDYVKNALKENTCSVLLKLIY